MQQPNFRALAWYPIVTVGLVMGAFNIVRTGRDAVFFDQQGLERLPLVNIWVCLAAIPVAYLNLRAMGRWGARAARTGLCVLGALVLLLFVPWLEREHDVAITLFFILGMLLFSQLGAVGWLLAADLLEGGDPAMVRRAYAWVGSGYIVGGLVGGLVAKLLALVLTPRLLVACGALVLVAAALLVHLAHASRPVDGPFPASRRRPGLFSAAAQPRSGLFDQPYIWTLIGISALGSAIALFIDFQFYAMATTSGRSNMQFFASFYTVLSLCSLVLQIFVAPQLQARFGIGGALMVLPLALLGGAGVVSFSTAVLTRSILKVTETGLRASLFRSIWEQVFLPIDQARRDAAKVLVDGLTANIASGVGAAVLYLWILNNRTPGQMQQNLGWISWVIAALSLTWAGLTVYLRRLGCESSPDKEVARLRLPDT